MRRIAVFPAGILVCPLFAATQPAQPPVHAPLNAHLAAQHARFSQTPFVPVVPEKYRVQLIDLNADATPEALVLMLGRDWGGTGGQTMFLFRGTKKGFTFLSRMTGIHAPMQGSLCVLDSKTRGWRDLGVRVSGGGAKAKFVRMRFDGTRYPLNPYVQPPMQDWPRGQFVLIHGDATAKAGAIGARVAARSAAQKPGGGRAQAGLVRVELARPQRARTHSPAARERPADGRDRAAAPVREL